MIWDRVGHRHVLRGTRWSMFIDRGQCWVYYQYGTGPGFVRGTFKTFEEACDYIGRQQ